MLYVPYPIILYPMMYELPWHPSQLNQKSYIISAVQSAFTITYLIVFPNNTTGMRWQRVRGVMSNYGLFVLLKLVLLLFLRYCTLCNILSHSLNTSFPSQALRTWLTCLMNTSLQVLGLCITSGIALLCRV